MALLHLNFESEYLYGNTDVSVIMPDKPREITPTDFYGNKQKYKVLWLLHGTYGDHTDWVRKSNIELYACEKDLVVVMPSALNSDYIDWPKFSTGYNAEGYLINELMPLIYNWLPVSDKREDNYIAGLSMGSMGAAQFAVWYPEKFAAAGLLSGSPLNWHNIPESRFDERTKTQIEALGGIEGVLASHRNVWDQIGELAGKNVLPRLYVTSGTDDFLYDDLYLPFKEHAKEIGLDATFEEIEGYNHEWRFWDITIQHALEFFHIDSSGAGNAF
jgi:putative tributyrin esterase